MPVVHMEPEPESPAGAPALVGQGSRCRSSAKVLPQAAHTPGAQEEGSPEEGRCSALDLNKDGVVNRKDAMSAIDKAKRKSKQAAQAVKVAVLAPAKGAETIWQKHKNLLYTARIIRELVPAFAISFSLFSILIALTMDELRTSFDFSAIEPWRSKMLDRVYWHFIFANGDWSNGNFTRERWWTAVERVDVYSRAAVSPGMTAWPEAQGRISWWDEEEDSLWCLAYKASDESYHVPFAGNGSCGPPAPIYDMWCSAGWDTNLYDSEWPGGFPSGGALNFPHDDAGWSCHPPNFWPATSDGKCYSVCLDISAQKAYAPPRWALDIFWFLAIPFLADVIFLFGWVNHKFLSQGFLGTMPTKDKVKFFAVGCGFYSIAIFCAVNTDSWRGQISPPVYPGTLFTWIMALLFGSYAIGIALEDHFCLIHCLMRPLYKLSNWLLGIKSEEDMGAQYAIDSDEALCFFLNRGFRTWLAWIKRFIAVLFTLGIVLFIVYWKPPTLVNGNSQGEPHWDFLDPHLVVDAHNPGRFISTQGTAILLLVVGFLGSLRPTKGEANFLFCERRATERSLKCSAVLPKGPSRSADQHRSTFRNGADQKRQALLPKDGWWGELCALALSAHDVVEYEALRYLGLEEKAEGGGGADKASASTTMDPSTYGLSAAVGFLG